MQQLRFTDKHVFLTEFKGVCSFEFCFACLICLKEAVNNIVFNLPLHITMFFMIILIFNLKS